MPARISLTAAVRTLLVAGFAIATGGAACGDRDRDLVASADGRGDSLSLIAPAFDHEVTSEDYRKWLVAEEALARVSGFRLADEIALESATDADVDRIAGALEANEPVRLAIESSGLTVKEYVETTVALEQALYASRPSAPRADAFVADDYRADIERVRVRSPLRVTRGARDTGDDDEWEEDDRDDDGDGNEGKKKKKKKKGGNGKGRGRGG